jgi:hypothetical protein
MLETTIESEKFWQTFTPHFIKRSATDETGTGAGFVAEQLRRSEVPW